MADWLIQHLDGAFAKIRAGEFAATTDTVAVLTGRPPRSIGDFVTDDADAFAPIAQPALAIVWREATFGARDEPDYVVAAEIVGHAGVVGRERES
jgi:hypothetical protein